MSLRLPHRRLVRLGAPVAGLGGAPATPACMDKVGGRQNSRLILRA